MDNALHRQILDAHSDGAKTRLVTLYTRAADFHEKNGNSDAVGYFLTQAYIYALEQGLDIASELHSRLVESGREA